MAKKFKENEKEWIRFDKAIRGMISRFDPKDKDVVLPPKNVNKILVK